MTQSTVALYLPELDKALKDDKLYLLYDRTQIRSYEDRHPLSNIGDITGCVLFSVASAIAVTFLALIVLCTVKLIPLVPTLIDVAIVLGILLFIMVVAVNFRPSFNTALCIETLLRKGASANPLVAADFCGQPALRRLSEGRTSLDDGVLFFVLMQIVLSVLVLREVEFKNLQLFMWWYAVVWVDSLTLTIFNLVDRFGGKPIASGFILTIMQIVMVTTIGTNLMNRILIAFRGYILVSGNKFKARYMPLTVFWEAWATFGGSSGWWNSCSAGWV